MLTLVITAAANVPRNQELDRAPIDTVQQQRIARERFEARWNRWNLACTVTSTAALTMLTISSLG